MQEAIEELEKALEHLGTAREKLPPGKPYDQDHYRQLLLHEAADKIRFILSTLERQEKQE